MSKSRLLILRLLASGGWFALLAASIASAILLVPHAWRDLDDANTRMHLFRFHVYDPDFIWAAVAFGADMVIVAAMFACCLWLLWNLIGYWRSQRGAHHLPD